jgi:hypothetical protein
MYYVNFDSNGRQAEAKWFDGVFPEEDGWYMADIDISGKRYKLVSGEILEMTAEEVDLENGQSLLETSLFLIKDARNKKLLESDWTVNPEVPMTEEKKAQWASYRQALRDFPSTITIDLLKSGADLQWPVLPS